MIERNMKNIWKNRGLDLQSLDETILHTHRLGEHVLNKYKNISLDYKKSP